MDINLIQKEVLVLQVLEADIFYFMTSVLAVSFVQLPARELLKQLEW